MERCLSFPLSDILVIGGKTNTTPIVLLGKLCNRVMLLEIKE